MRTLGGTAARLAGAVFAVGSLLGGVATAEVPTSTQAEVDPQLLGNDGLPPGLLDAVLDDPGADIGLSIYGFSDFTVSKFEFLDDAPIAAVIPQNLNFFIGNLNIYLRSTFDRFTFLSEVRFLYEPHGSPERFGSGYVSEVTTDHADLYRRISVGSIEIERAWLEYEVVPELVVRVGQWLTPYGIWNVDHGSPTVIAVYRPYTIGEQLFPERQAGFQIWGRRSFDYFDLSYHVTLSNGRGPFDAYLDLDDNKALGGRVVLHRPGALDLQIGLSAYYGRYTNLEPNFALDPQRGFFSSPEITEQYDEFGLAADLRLRFAGVLVQAEFVSNQRRYTEEGRRTVYFHDDRLIPDHRFWGGYFVIAYDLGFLGLRPFVLLERNGHPINVVQLQKAVSLTGGLNVRMHPRVVLKAQATLHIFDVDIVDISPRLLGLDFQAAWAF